MLYVCIVHNIYKAMSNTTDPYLCSRIINVCKPPKIFDFPEIAKPFTFDWFEQFP